MGAPIFFMSASLDQASGLHPFEQGGHGIRIAAHGLRQFALGHVLLLEQSAHDGELVGCNAQRRNPPAKSLVQAVPGSPQQERQTPALR